MEGLRVSSCTSVEPDEVEVLPDVLQIGLRGLPDHFVADTRDRDDLGVGVLRGQFLLVLEGRDGVQLSAEEEHGRDERPQVRRPIEPPIESHVGQRLIDHSSVAPRGSRVVRIILLGRGASREHRCRQIIGPCVVVAGQVLLHPHRVVRPLTGEDHRAEHLLKEALELAVREPPGFAEHGAANAAIEISPVVEEPRGIHRSPGVADEDDGLVGPRSERLDDRREVVVHRPPLVFVCVVPAGEPRSALVPEDDVVAFVRERLQVEHAPVVGSRAAVDRQQNRVVGITERFGVKDGAVGFHTGKRWVIVDGAGDEIPRCGWVQTRDEQKTRGEQDEERACASHGCLRAVHDTFVGPCSENCACRLPRLRLQHAFERVAHILARKIRLQRNTAVEGLQVEGRHAQGHREERAVRLPEHHLGPVLVVVRWIRSVRVVCIVFGGLDRFRLRRGDVFGALDISAGDLASGRGVDAGAGRPGIDPNGDFETAVADVESRGVLEPLEHELGETVVAADLDAGGDREPETSDRARVVLHRQVEVLEPLPVVSVSARALGAERQYAGAEQHLGDRQLDAGVSGQLDALSPLGARVGHVDLERVEIGVEALVALLFAGLIESDGDHAGPDGVDQLSDEPGGDVLKASGQVRSEGRA